MKHIRTETNESIKRVIVRVFDYHKFLYNNSESEPGEPTKEYILPPCPICSGKGYRTYCRTVKASSPLPPPKSTIEQIHSTKIYSFPGAGNNAEELVSQTFKVNCNYCDGEYYTHPIPFYELTVRGFDINNVDF